MSVSSVLTQTTGKARAGVADSDMQMDSNSDEIISSGDPSSSPQKSNAQSSKERLSPYFTIAAATFGLISDGCK